MFDRNHLLKLLHDNSEHRNSVADVRKKLSARTLDILNVCHPDTVHHKYESYTPEKLKEFIEYAKNNEHLILDNFVNVCEYTYYFECTYIQKLYDIVKNDDTADENVIEYIRINIENLCIEVHHIADCDLLQYFVDNNFLHIDLIKKLADNLSADTFYMWEWYLNFYVDSGNTHLIKKNILNAFFKNIRSGHMRFYYMLLGYVNKGIIPPMNNYYDRNEECMTDIFIKSQSDQNKKMAIAGLYMLHRDGQIELGNLSNILPAVVSILDMDFLNWYIDNFSNVVPHTDFCNTLAYLYDSIESNIINNQNNTNDMTNYLSIINKILDLFMQHYHIIKTQYPHVFANFIYYVKFLFKTDFYLELIEKYYQMIDFSYLYGKFLRHCNDFDIIDKIYEYGNMFGETIKIYPPHIASSMLFFNTDEIYNIYQIRDYLWNEIVNMKTTDFINEYTLILEFNDLFRITDIHDVLNIDFVMSIKDVTTIMIRKLPDDELVKYFEYIHEHCDIYMSKFDVGMTRATCYFNGKTAAAEWLTNFYSKNETNDASN